MNEVKNVLARPKFRKQFKTLTDEMIASFLFEIENLASSSDQPPHSIKFPRDPKDEKFINLAIEVEADYIVSRDRDLLDLMTDHTDEAKGFRQRFRKLKIVDPVEFLRIIREMDLALEP